MINLYSDTQTLPTDAMYEAMKTAELGDDVQRADPTVNLLEEKVAKLFGKEAAILMPTGTMANLASLLVHGKHGSEVFLEPANHVYLYEAGALCSVAGYTPTFFQANRGRPDPDSFRQSIRMRDDHFPNPRVLWLENTHNAGGGVVLQPELQKEMVHIARENELSVHVDGARIFNASTKLNIPVSDLVSNVDSIGFCLSKGLSCPLGSVLVGTESFCDEARRVRKRLGGGMRQAGIVAACGLVALESEVPRLKEDHENALQLAEGLAQIDGLGVDPSRVETNMIFIDTSGWKVEAYDATLLLKEKGVLISDMNSTTLRVVTHRMFKREEISEVINIFKLTKDQLV